MEVVASLSQGRTAAAQCGLFTHKSVPVIFEPSCTCIYLTYSFEVWKFTVPCAKTCMLVKENISCFARS